MDTGVLRPVKQGEPREALGEEEGTGLSLVCVQIPASLQAEPGFQGKRLSLVFVLQDPLWFLVALSGECWAL